MKYFLSRNLLKRKFSKNKLYVRKQYDNLPPVLMIIFAVMRKEIHGAQNRKYYVIREKVCENCDVEWLNREC